MKQYQDMLRHILDTGIKKSDRTGTGTISTFGYQMRFDLSQGFPLVTTKKTHLRSIIHELLWFISGSTSNKDLNEKGVTIWDEWQGKDGELGAVYGHQWRSFLGEYRRKDGTLVGYGRTVETSPWKGTIESLKGFDQLQWVINRIRTKPDCRRMIVSAWNPLEVEDQALPPCHTMFQFNVAGGKLHCHMYQRSADSFLGVPFNIASYALLTMMVAKITGYEPGHFIHSFGDLHIYLNHLDQVNLLLSREPKALPTMLIQDRGQKEIEDFVFEDFQLVGYDPWPAIKADVSV